ncbi:MAG: TRAP transporter substrate-binding protein DctP [Alphaproteobacteria bacterium]
MRPATGLMMAIAILLVGQVPAAAQTIKLGTLAPEGSPWYRVLRDLGETWREVSGGRLDLRIYPGGVAGDEPDMVRKMRVGQLHAAALSGGGLSRIAPEIQALQMPMMFRTDEELDYTRERIAPTLEAALEAKGFKVLSWSHAGWVHFFARQPVVRPEDLKPLRLFVWSGDTAYIEAWKDAGYRPIPLAATEIHTALQSGLIDAFATTPIAALSFQWFGLASHMTDLKWAPLAGALVISQRMWEEIPADMRPLLIQAARDAGVHLQQEARRLDAESIEVMKKHGLVVHNVPADVAARWEQSARASYPRIVGPVVPDHIVAEVERLRDEYRAAGGDDEG